MDLLVVLVGPQDAALVEGVVAQEGLAVLDPAVVVKVSGIRVAGVGHVGIAGQGAVLVLITGVHGQFLLRHERIEAGGGLVVGGVRDHLDLHGEVGPDPHLGVSALLADGVLGNNIEGGVIFPFSVCCQGAVRLSGQGALVVEHVVEGLGAVGAVPGGLVGPGGNELEPGAYIGLFGVVGHLVVQDVRSVGPLGLVVVVVVRVAGVPQGLLVLRLQRHVHPKGQGGVLVLGCIVKEERIAHVFLCVLGRSTGGFVIVVGVEKFLVGVLVKGGDVNEGKVAPVLPVDEAPVQIDLFHLLVVRVKGLRNRPSKDKLYDDGNVSGLPHAVCGVIGHGEAEVLVAGHVVGEAAGRVDQVWLIADLHLVRIRVARKRSRHYSARCCLGHLGKVVVADVQPVPLALVGGVVVVIVVVPADTDLGDVALSHGEGHVNGVGYLGSITLHRMGGGGPHRAPGGLVGGGRAAIGDGGVGQVHDGGGGVAVDVALPLDLHLGQQRGLFVEEDHRLFHVLAGHCVFIGMNSRHGRIARRGRRCRRVHPHCPGEGRAAVDMVLGIRGGGDGGGDLGVGLSLPSAARQNPWW